MQALGLVRISKKIKNTPVQKLKECWIWDEPKLLLQCHQCSDSTLRANEISNSFTLTNIISLPW